MSYDRFWDKDYFAGVAYGVAATENGCTGIYYNYSIERSVGNLERRKEMRIGRLEKLAKSKKLPKLREDTLQDDIFVLFGPDMSPKSAIASLLQVVKEIETNGLMVGRDAEDHDIKETLSGALLDCDG